MKAQLEIQILNKLLSKMSTIYERPWPAQLYNQRAAIKISDKTESKSKEAFLGFLVISIYYHLHLSVKRKTRETCHMCYFVLEEQALN